MAVPYTAIFRFSFRFGRALRSTVSGTVMVKNQSNGPKRGEIVRRDSLKKVKFGNSDMMVTDLAMTLAGSFASAASWPAT